MAHRTAHEGHYYTEKRKRKNGSSKLYYCWKIQLGSRGDSEPIVVKRTTSEARKAAVVKKLKELESKGFLEKAAADLTVRQHLNNWLELKVKPNRENKTYTSYKGMCENHIFPAIGGIKVSRLTDMHVQRVVAGVQAKVRPNGEPLGNRTAIYAVAVLRSGIGRKVKDVMDAVELPPPPDPRDRVMDESEIMAVLVEAYRQRELVTRPGEIISVHRNRHAFMFEINSGLRINELLGTQIIDINFRDATLQISKQLEWYKDAEGATQWKLKSKPKSKHGRRLVHLNDEAVQALRDQIAMIEADKELAGEGYEDHGLLFPTERGTPQHDRNVRRALDAILDKTKLPDGSKVEDVTLHDFRRSYLTWLADSEERRHVVASIAGHANPSTTEKYYVFAREARKREASRKIGFSLVSKMPVEPKGEQAENA